MSRLHRTRFPESALYHTRHRSRQCSRAAAAAGQSDCRGFRKCENRPQQQQLVCTPSYLRGHLVDLSYAVAELCCEVEARLKFHLAVSSDDLASGLRSCLMTITTSRAPRSTTIYWRSLVLCSKVCHSRVGGNTQHLSTSRALYWSALAILS